MKIKVFFYLSPVFYDDTTDIKEKINFLDGKKTWYIY